jgi:hypothetical protein
MKPKVRYEPRKEIIIHEYTKYDSPEEFVENIARGAPAGSMIASRWVDGVLLMFVPFPNDPVTTKEFLEGRVHWNHLNFAFMPEYKEQIITESGVTLVIGDVSKNSSFQAIAEFVKEKFGDLP